MIGDIKAYTSVVADISNSILAIVAVAAFLTGLRQLSISKKQIDVSRETARIERTSDLLRETSQDEMQFLFGFFDFTSDPIYSKTIFMRLYDKYIRSQRRKIIKGAPLDMEILASQEAEMIDCLDSGMREDDAFEINDYHRRIELRNQIISATSFFERVWILMKNGLIDERIFLQDHDYDIVCTYFVIEGALVDLTASEEFDFDDVRSLALRAQAAYSTRSTPNETLATARFEKL